MTSPTDRLDHEPGRDWRPAPSDIQRLANWCADRADEARQDTADYEVASGAPCPELREWEANYRSLAALLRGAEAPRADAEKIDAIHREIHGKAMRNHDAGTMFPRALLEAALLDFANAVKALGGVSPRAQTTPSAEVLRDALRPLISREAVTDAALLNVADGLRDADFWGSPSPEAPSPKGIYIASRSRHGQRWVRLRESGVPIISTWINESGEGQTADWTDLWNRCLRESASAKALILYAERYDDYAGFKGAWAEAGAALANGVPVYFVAPSPWDDYSASLLRHRLVTFHATLDGALDEIAGSVSSPTSTPLTAEQMREIEAERQKMAAQYTGLSDAARASRNVGDTSKRVNAAAPLVEQSPDRKGADQ